MQTQTSPFLEQMATELNLDPPTKTKAYELLTLVDEEEKVLLSFRKCQIRAPMAIYVASQIAVVNSMTGEVTYGNGVTLTQVHIYTLFKPFYQIIRSLNDQVDIENFFEKLGNFLNNIKPHIPSTLQTPLELSVARSAMCFRIYKKFDKCLSMLGIKRLWREHRSSNDEEQDGENGSSTPIFNQEQEQRRPEDSQQFQYNDQEYLLHLKNLAWIQFLLLKQEAQSLEEVNQNIVSHPDIQRTMLLIAHISSIILALPDGYVCTYLLPFLKQPDSFPSREERQTECSTIISQVSLMVANHFQATEGFEEDIMQQMALCQNIIADIRNTGLNQEKTTTNGSQNPYYGLLNATQIAVYYRKFHALYGKITSTWIAMKTPNGLLDHHSSQVVQLDEECFLRLKIVFTPNKRTSQYNHQHELLSNGGYPYYEFTSRQEQGLEHEDIVNKKVKLNGLIFYFVFQDQTHMTPNKKSSDFPLFQHTPMKPNVFPSNGLLDKRSEKDKMAQSTPISTMMQQNEWLKKIAQMQNDTPLDEFMHQVSGEYYATFTSKIQTKILQFVNHENNNLCLPLLKLYLKVLERMINTEAIRQPETIISLLQNQDFIFALLAITIETHQHIINKKVDLNYLLACCGISTVEFWRIISNFANFHESIPPSLTQHLFDLEKNVLLYWIWQDKWETILNILVEKGNYTHSLRYFESVLLRRFHQHLGLRVTELATILEMEDHVRDKAWQIISAFMDKPPNQVVLWEKRHFDMHIICTFYMITKQLKKNPEFKKFKLAYEKRLPQEQVKIVFSNLIQFYNDHYLQHFKTLLPPITSSNQISVFNSPLPQVVPKQFLLQSPYMKGSLQAVEAIYEFGSPAQPKFRQTPQIPPFSVESEQPFVSSLAGRIARLNRNQDS